MRALLAIATLLLASGAAQAQYTIEYGGHTIRIDPDRGTVSIPGVYDNTGKKTKRGRGNQDGSQKQVPTPQQQTTIDPQPAASEPTNQPAQAIQAPAPVSAAPQAPNAVANSTPAAAAVPAQSQITAPVPVQQTIAPTVSPAAATATPQAPATLVARPQAPASTTATAPPIPPPAPAQSPAARPQTSTATVAMTAPAAVVADPNSPVGIWLTEEKEGKVRIEPCGTNLCGYSVDSKSNANGEQVLINMKPGKDQKWSGRIHDPNTDSNYDSTIALKGKDELRVQGCAFGGMFCGGQTWTRVN